MAERWVAIARAELISDRSGGQDKKKRFVDAHLADAQKAADKLGVPVENVLGVSAVESNWGESRFAVQGNNFFGIHYPAPFAAGYIAAKSGVKVATFTNYADSLSSFVAIAGADVQGLGDPYDFAAALHSSGKFGVGNPSYAEEVGKTIKGLQSIVSEHSI
jgi:Mannosyl-glycoprotein endo-beta-N-acetylglucosaminidase